MSLRKKISISQNPSTSTTGRVPLRESVEYYLDIKGLIPSVTQDHLRTNRGLYPFVDNEIVEALSEPENIDVGAIIELGVQLAQKKISGLHLDIPATLMFEVQDLESIEGVEGTPIECFGMTLIQSELG